MDTPCIEYGGNRNKAGYGVLPKAVHGSRLAHRAALAEHLGRPVDGFALHSCDNPPCINPDHLSEGDHAENMRQARERGRARGGRYNQTHCIRGHELRPENVRLKSNPECRSGFERVCILCSQERNRQQAARRKAMRHQRGLLRKRKEIA